MAYSGYQPSDKEYNDIVSYWDAVNGLETAGRGTAAILKNRIEKLSKEYTPEQINKISTSEKFVVEQEKARAEGWKGMLPTRAQMLSAAKVAGAVGLGAAGLTALAGAGGAAAAGGAEAAGGAGAGGAAAGGGGLVSIPGSTAIMAPTYAAPAGVVSTAAEGGGILGSLGGSKAVGGALNLAGTLLGGKQAKQAAEQTAAAQIEAARIAAEAQKFRPVGVTTRFGQSKFGYDAQGNLISAGYELSPELKAQQDALMGLSGDYLKQYQGAIEATAPMGAGAQTMMGLGKQYLAKSPEEQAALYMQQQRALLAGGQERQMADIQARLQAQGRGGLAIGGTSTGLRPSNPELDAYYNALAQQELAMAAQATQGGMEYAKFGAGMLGAGGQMLGSMYGTQQAAYQPYATALGGAAGLEQLGAQPLELGTAIGAKTTAGTAAAGQLLGQGISQAAQTTQETRSQSPWADILAGAGRYVGSL